MSTTTPSTPTAVPDPFDKESEVPEEKPEPKSPLEDLERQVEHRTWEFRGVVRGIMRGGAPVEQEVAYTFVQKPLSYPSMMQFTGMIGQKIDQAMSGPDALSVGAIAELANVAQIASSGNLAAAAGSMLMQDESSGIDMFVRGFAKLASYIPEILEEAQCIWLRVPLSDRWTIRQLWSNPVDEGGMSMDDGEEMFDLFLRQNYEDVEDFFTRRLRRIMNRVQTERKRLHPSTD